MTLLRRIKTVQSSLQQRREVLRFDDIPEPRRRRGRRWSAAALLSTAVLSLMLLARSLRAAERLSRDLADARWVKKLRRRWIVAACNGDIIPGCGASRTNWEQLLRCEPVVIQDLLTFRRRGT